MTRKYIEDRRKLDESMMDKEPDVTVVDRSERFELNLNLPAQKSCRIRENCSLSSTSCDFSSREQRVGSEDAEDSGLAYETPAKRTFTDYLEVGDDVVDDVTEDFLEDFENRATSHEEVTATETYSPRLFGQRLSRSLDSSQDFEIQGSGNAPSTLKSSRIPGQALTIRRDLKTKQNCEEPSQDEILFTGQDSSGEKHISKASRAIPGERPWSRQGSSVEKNESKALHAFSDGMTDSSGRRPGRIIKLPSSLRSNPAGEVWEFGPDKKFSGQRRVLKELYEDGQCSLLRKSQSFQGRVSQKHNLEDDQVDLQPRGSTLKIMRSESAPLTLTNTHQRFLHMLSKSSRSLDHSHQEIDAKANKSVFTRIQGLKKKSTVFDRISFLKSNDGGEVGVGEPSSPGGRSLVQSAGHDILPSFQVDDADVTNVEIEKSTSLKRHANHDELSLQDKGHIWSREFKRGYPRSDELNCRGLSFRDIISKSINGGKMSALSSLASHAVEGNAFDVKVQINKPYFPLKGGNYALAEIQTSPSLMSRPDLGSEDVGSKTPSSLNDKSRRPVIQETLDDKLSSVMIEKPLIAVGTISPVLGDTVSEDLDSLGFHAHPYQCHSSARDQGPIASCGYSELASSSQYLPTKHPRLEGLVADDQYKEDGDCPGLYESNRKNARFESKRESPAGPSELGVDGSLLARDHMEKDMNSGNGSTQSSLLPSGRYSPANCRKSKFTNLEDGPTRHPHSDNLPDPRQPPAVHRFCKKRPQLPTGRCDVKVGGGGLSRGLQVRQGPHEKPGLAVRGNAARQALKATEAAIRAEQIAMAAVAAANEAKAKAEVAKSMALLEEFGEDSHRTRGDLDYQGMPLQRTRSFSYY